MIYDVGVRRNCLAMVLFMLVTAGCSEDLPQPPATPYSIPWEQPPRQPLPPPSLTVDQLLAAPDSLLVDGMRLSAGVYLNRDFMLGGPPEGSPLSAIAYLNGSPPGSLPASISDVYLWAVRDSSEVWNTTMNFQYIDWSRNGAQIYQGGGGPLWDPGILIDVVIGVRASPTKVSLALFRDVLITSSI
jgi:hypothetical protein